MYSSVYWAIGQQGSRDEQEDQRECRQNQRQGDLVRRALAVGSLDETNHPIQEGVALVRGDLDDDTIRKNMSAAGDAGAIAAGLANHGRRFPGNGRLIYRGYAFNDLAVAGNGLAGDDHHPVAGFRSVETVSSISPLSRRRDAGVSRRVLRRASA